MLTPTTVHETSGISQALRDLTVRYAVEATDRAHEAVADAVKILASSFDGPGLVDELGRLAHPEMQQAALVRAKHRLDMAFSEVARVIACREAN